MHVLRPSLLGASAPVLTLVVCLVAGCPSGTNPEGPPDAGPTPSGLLLDGQGAVRTTFQVTGPAGLRATLAAGTVIALADTSAPPASTDALGLTLVAEPGTPPALPAGIFALQAFRIVLTVNGTEREAFFWPQAAGQGLRLSLAVSDSRVNLGTLGLLFQTRSGKAVRVASAAPRTPTASGGGRGGGPTEMEFGASQTGSFQAGGAGGGAGGPPPAGAYWATYSVADPGCVPVDNVQVCGPSRVDRIEITEESTAEILGLCNFGDSDTASTGVLPPGYEFFCQRQQPAGGGTTEITVSSMQANLPIVHAYLVKIETKTPMWETYTRAAVLNAPGGPTADPYQKKEWTFAGFKQLILTSKDKDLTFLNDKGLKPLREAGYEVVQHSYRSTSPGFVADIGVHDTLVARALLQQDVLGKEKWKVQTGEKETWGNKGTSDHSSRYRGTFTATMPFPGSSALVWKITAEDVPFVIDPSQSAPGAAVYSTPSGTLTQVSYTVPGVIGCSGDPASFTDTLTILPGDGTLSVKALGNGQVEYVGSASISKSPELVDHPFQRCCSYTDPSCEPDVLKKTGQEHEWWLTGNSPQTGPAEGPLTGTFSQSMGARYEWTLVRDDQ